MLPFVPPRIAIQEVWSGWLWVVVVSIWEVPAFPTCRPLLSVVWPWPDEVLILVELL